MPLLGKSLNTGMRNLISLVEGTLNTDLDADREILIDQNETGGTSSVMDRRHRIAQLQEAKRLIDLALQHGEITVGTMKEIVDLTRKRDTAIGDGVVLGKHSGLRARLNQRIVLENEKTETYKKLRRAIGQEIVRLSKNQS